MKKICLIVALVGLFVMNVLAIDGINEDFGRASYKTPIPAAVKYPFYNDYKSLIESVAVKYLKWSSGTVTIEDKSYNYPVEMSQAEKDAVDQAEADAAAALAAALAQAQIDWQNSKTNHNDIILWENKFMSRLADMNAILVSEGIIAEALSVTNTLPEDFGTYAIQATNASTASLALALDADLKYVRIHVEKNIGNPPDGSTILQNIISH